MYAKFHWNQRKHVRRFPHKCSRALPVSLWRLILQLKVIEFQFFNLLSKIKLVKLTLWRFSKWCFSRGWYSHDSSFSTIFALDSHNLILFLALIPYLYPCKAMVFLIVCMRYCLLGFFYVLFFFAMLRRNVLFFYFFSALSFIFLSNPF